ncbi:response regulator, partial [bacterium]|nr:response regulator [bacterium]
LELSREPFSLRDCLDSAAQTLSFRAHQKGLELACDVQVDVPDRLVGDPLRLRQILINLAGNAIKFTDHGEVVVGARLLAWDAKTIEIGFDVKDTGIGIPRDKVDSIFEHFTQADTSSTRAHGGTGLGLTISQRLATMMGGRIWVESEVGRGSTFHFTARFACGAESGASSDAALPPVCAGARVLVVDDNATNRRILQHQIGHWGLRCVTVDGGQAALAELLRAAAVAEPYKLVVLDGQMPGMDGIATAESIRASRELAGIEIVMLSSGSTADDSGRCGELRIAATMTKPVKRSDLIERLSRILGAAAAARPAPAPAAAAPVLPLDVLLVDDNDFNRVLAQRLLEKWQHRVVTAADGLQALAALAERSFDVVLMDVQMPRMDGFQATQEIRRCEALSGGHVPIIALTAHAMSGDRERCLAAGMDGYLPKPITGSALVAAIAEVVGRVSADQPADPLSATTSPVSSR